MQLAIIPALLLLHAAAGTGSVARGTSTITPVQKVVELMTEMMDKGKQETHEEQVQYAAYKQFCDDTTVEKQKAIADAAQAIELLNADIQSAASHAEQLSSEIAGHQTDVAGWEGDQQSATEVRKAENADYEALHMDYSESIDALERAIQTLKAQDYAREQASGSSLAQVAAIEGLRLIPAEAKRSLQLFLSQDQTSQEVGAPEAAAYEFQSGDIVETLEGLLAKFKKERQDLEKQEMNSKHAYTLLMQDLSDNIAAGNKDAQAKTAAKGKTLQSKAEDEGTLADTSATKAADESYLGDLTGTCAQKASDFEARQKLRAEELEAIQQAIDIISSAEVSGNADRYLPSMLQRNDSRAALAHLRASATSTDNQQKAKQYLEAQSKKLHSRMLSTVAEQVKDDDPLAKVKQMIQDLVVRLMEEANQEADHKAWCDTEVSTNEFTRNEKSEAADTLNSQIDSLESNIAQLASDIAELNQGVADLEKAMAEATELRAKEKAENAQTVSDAQAGQGAVAQAMSVLQKFYGKALDATALVQQQPVAPEIFDSPYKGMQGENKGVIGMLEVIESDFARLEADTHASEAASLKEYEGFMGDSNLDKTVKEKEIAHKTSSKERDEQALAAARTDLETTQKELDAALAYYEKLKPACIDLGTTYEDRASSRAEEIQSLKEALTILSGSEE